RVVACCSCRLMQLGTLGRGAHVGGVQGQTGEGQTADQVTQGCGNLVPDHVIHHREVAAHDHAEGEQEHVHYRVLEAHEEEQHDRHPHGDGLAADGGG